MYLNIDCMRMILKYCVKNLDYKQNNMGSWIKPRISLNELYTCDELENYEKKDIMYSVMKLHEYNYLILENITPQNTVYIDSCYITDITIYGHNFHSSIQEENIWDKTKKIMGNAGNHTLKFVEETAQIIAVETAKQAVTVMMNKI